MCRTRVIGNIHGKETPQGRGNLSFSTLNLPMIAVESENVDDFFIKLEKYATLLIDQLYDRYLFQSKKRVRNFTFLYTQGLWSDSEKLDINDNLEEILKTGTLSVGFVGLAECLVSLIGKHHGEDDNAQSLGLKIVKFMRELCDKATEEYNMNYSLLATPAESYAGRALKITKDKHGVIEGVTDKEYFTNSFHVPVGYSISAFKKINKEAPYHAYCNAGHITYIELSGDVSKNLDGIETIVKHMKESGIGYGAINVPVDTCTECGLTAVIYSECPKCGNTDQNKISRYRRITGYLTGTLDRWNSSKRNEEIDRVKHQ